MIDLSVLYFTYMTMYILYLCLLITISMNDYLC